MSSSCLAREAFPLKLVPAPGVIGVFVIGDLKLQPWDTMSLIEADLGLVCVRARSYFGSNQTPQEDHPVPPLHEPLHWRAKRDPKAHMLSLQSFLRKGVVLAYVGSIQHLKGLELDPAQTASVGLRIRGTGPPAGS